MPSRAVVVQRFGRVERCGPGAARFRAGVRVAAFVLNGAKAERVNVPERWLVAVPGAIADDARPSRARSTPQGRRGGAGSARSHGGAEAPRV